MRIETTTITKKTLHDLDRLDPVTMILEDLGSGRGKLTVSCYDKSWHAYWGAMGSETIAQFVHTADVHYIAGKLSGIPSRVTDYDAISEKIGHQVERESLALFQTELAEAYGQDWHFDLPQTDNPDYTYLCRIVSAVKEAVALELNQAA